MQEKIIPFEDLIWLFNGGSQSRNICRLDLEEAAYIYKHVKSLNNPFCVEIGRYFGGSAMLLSSAGARLLSIDNYSKDKRRSMKYDELLRVWSTDRELQIVVADSRNYDTSNLTIDVLLIDGDHRYESVKADVANFYNAVVTGGSVFFHDSNIPGVSKVINENADLFNMVKKVNSLIHVRKK